MSIFEELNAEITGGTTPALAPKPVLLSSPDDTLTTAVIGQESAGNPQAVSPKGAMGIMQVMPDTAREMAEKLGDDYSPDKLMDPYWNERWGNAYLQEGLDRYDGDIRFALARYHAGPKVDRIYEEYKRTGEFSIPRTASWYDGHKYTADYVPEVMERMGKDPSSAKSMGGGGSLFEELTQELASEKTEIDKQLQENSGTVDGTPSPGLFAELDAEITGQKSPEPYSGPPLQVYQPDKNKQNQLSVHWEGKDTGEQSSNAMQAFRTARDPETKARWFLSLSEEQRSDLPLSEEDAKELNQGLAAVKQKAAGEAFGMGMVMASPIRQISSKKAKQYAQSAMDLNPTAATMGGVASNAIQAVGGAQAVGKLFTGVGSTIARQALTRAVTGGAVSAGQQDWGNLPEAVANTAQNVGGGLVSIIPEVLAPAGVAQVIAQPLADLIYDVAVGKVRDEKVMSKDWWMREIANLGVSAGFAIKDASSGEVFKVEQGKQRAELRNWLDKKGQNGFEIVSTGQDLNPNAFKEADAAAVDLNRRADYYEQVGQEGRRVEAASEARQEAEARPNRTQRRAALEEGMTDTAPDNLAMQVREKYGDTRPTKRAIMKDFEVGSREDAADLIARAYGEPGEAKPTIQPKTKEVLTETSPESKLPEAGDRRQYPRRKRVSEMTREEMQKALSEDELTGVGSRLIWLERADDFKEAEFYGKKPPLEYQGIADVDGLKTANDEFGYDVGDKLLRHVADVMKEAGVEAYRIGGDEVRFVGGPDVEAKVQQARDMLKDRSIEIVLEDGTVYDWKGMGFSYGLAKNEVGFENATKLADENLHAEKSAREKAGVRAGRGEKLPGLVKRTDGEAREGGGYPDEEARPLDEWFDQPTEEVSSDPERGPYETVPGPPYDAEVGPTEIDRSQFFSDYRTSLRKKIRKGLGGARQWNLVIGKPGTKGKLSEETQSILESEFEYYNTTEGREVLDQLGVKPPEHFDDVGEWLKQAPTQKELSQMRSAAKAEDKRKAEELGGFFDEMAKQNAIPLPGADFPEAFESPEQGPAAGYARVGRGESGTDYNPRRPARAFAEWYKGNFTKAGEVGSDVHAEKISKDGYIASQLKEVQYTVKDFRDSVRSAYGKSKVPEKEMFRIDQALKGEIDIDDLPEAVRLPVKTMRNHIDALSRQLIRLGVVDGDLAATVAENLGVYAMRSYKVFDDPKWADHVKKKAPGLINRAKAFLRSEFDIKDDEVLNGMIDELLYRSGGPIEFLAKGGKIGSMDRSILKNRKDIPMEIRALWGEYKDAEVNYVKSVSKMSSLIANHQFLQNVRSIGENKFLFSEPRVRGDKSYSVKIAAEGDLSLKPLDGMYTTKEFKAAFEKAASNKILPKYVQAYMSAVSTVKVAKTVLNPAGAVRNATSNIAALIGNGYVNIPKVVGRVVEIAKDRKTYRDYVKRLTELQVLGDGLNQGELRAMLSDANMSDWDAIVSKGVQSTARSGFGVAQKVYGFGDAIAKIISYESELARHRKAFPDLPAEDVEQMAASKVRDVMQTYSNLPDKIKALRRVPVIGTFSSFSWEVLRNVGNTMRLISSEMKDPNTRAIGAQRLAGALAVGAGLPAALIARRNLLGITKDDETDAREHMAPWEQNQPIYWVEPIENGKGKYINLGYTDMHAYLKAPVIAMLRGKSPEEASVEVIKELLEPFFGEDILTSHLIDISRNKTKDGREIYNQGEPWENQAADIIEHVYKAFEPGAFATIRRMYQGATGQENSMGKPYDLGNELKTLVTGLRVNDFDANKSLYFDALQHRRDKTNASRTRRKRGEAAGYQASSKAFEGLYEKAWAAMRLGVKPADVKATLKEAGVSKGDIQKLMTGVSPEDVRATNDQFTSLLKEGNDQKTLSWIRSMRSSDIDLYRQYMREFRLYQKRKD